VVAQRGINNSNLVRRVRFPRLRSVLPHGVARIGVWQFGGAARILVRSLIHWFLVDLVGDFAHALFKLVNALAKSARHLRQAPAKYKQGDREQNDPLKAGWQANGEQGRKMDC
jgi:hypothetical protein